MEDEKKLLYLLIGITLFSFLWQPLAILLYVGGRELLIMISSYVYMFLWLAKKRIMEKIDRGKVEYEDVVIKLKIYFIIRFAMLNIIFITALEMLRNFYVLKKM